MIFIEADWVGHNFFIRLGKVRILSGINGMFNGEQIGRKKTWSRAKRSAVFLL